MLLFKRFICALVLLPVFAFANVYDDPTLDATFNKVSPGCYGAFRTAFGMLPEIADALNEKAGAELFLVTNVKTPLSNPSTFTMTVEKSPQGSAEGDYKLFQKYKDNTLYLRIDEMPSTLPTEQLDKMWDAVDKLFAACTL